MPVDVHVRGGHNFHIAEVTSSGEMIVAPLNYDETEYVLLDVNGAIYNFYGPKVRKQFVITGFIAVGNKNITGSPAEAIVEIFEANSSDADITNDKYKTLVKFALTTNQAISPTPIRILVNSGVWINATMDNDDVHLTVFGYYIKQL